MKMYVTAKRDDKKRTMTKIEGASATDQSYKKAVDINNIVGKFMKTGILPQTSVGKYGDFSQVPTLEEAYEAVQAAQDQFYGLPAEIRKEMDNDPSKMEIWLSDEKNYDSALKYGLIEAKVVEHTLGDVVDAINSNNNNNSQGTDNASVSD